MRHVGGQMQQSNPAAATALYENAGQGLPGGDTGDAVMARWLQSAGLQHLASPMTSNAVDHRMVPNLLVQGYGPQSAEEKQRIFKLMRNLNFNSENVSEPYTPNAEHAATFAPVDGFYSPEFRGDFGAGLLDLHSMDDTELLSDHVISEPFEPSPFMPAVTNAFEGDFDGINGTQTLVQTDTDAPTTLSVNEKELSTRENNVAKIKVVVRKRPLNKKEISRKEEDIVTVCDDAHLTVHEPKLKVDLTAYVEKHEFCFDAVLDENVKNDEVYRTTVEPIIPIIFQSTKATCFAYGQTGSGKTYTMQPLPLRAAEDLVRYLHQPVYRKQRFKLWLSYFEIYGGKLFDLLSDRKKLCMREDGKKEVCIVGLQEFEVSDVHVVKEYIEKGNSARSTGSTGANEESSRSHAILQLAVKKHPVIKESKRHNSTIDVNEPRAGKLIGKISFIDLAGSERGADTTDNDRQTRIEGAEINKSLLALKECIRALDNDQFHIPFRGSKLTEVLRDSFVGNSRTVMISCISPNSGSCEHTLNTLRYADRVKSLSKSGNPRKDQSNSFPSLKESQAPVNADADDDYDTLREPKASDTVGRFYERDTLSVNFTKDEEKQPSSSSNFSISAIQDTGVPVAGGKGENLDVGNASKISSSQKIFTVGYSENSSDVEEKPKKASPPRRKSYKDDRIEKQVPGIRKDVEYLDKSPGTYKQRNSKSSGVMSASASASASTTQNEPNLTIDGDINEILEEEEALVAAHRKEIEDTMEIVREEMRLLAEVDQPGSHIDNYVTQLSFMLSRKAASLVGLQARLARFQHRLREQEILSRKRVPH